MEALPTAESFHGVQDMLIHSNHLSMLLSNWRAQNNRFINNFDNPLSFKEAIKRHIACTLAQEMSAVVCRALHYTQG